MLTYAQPGLPAVCSAETQPERWHTDHEWQLSQHTAKRKRKDISVLQTNTGIKPKTSTCNNGLQVSCTAYSTVLMPWPFSDKCLCVFTWKGLPALRCWSGTTERGSEPATSRARLSPAPPRHRIITEGKSDCLTSEAFTLYSLGFLPGWYYCKLLLAKC